MPFTKLMEGIWQTRYRVVAKPEKPKLPVPSQSVANQATYIGTRKAQLVVKGDDKGWVMEEMRIYKRGESRPRDLEVVVNVNTSWDMMTTPSLAIIGISKG